MPRVLTRRRDHGEAVQARGRRGEAERKVGEEALTGGARLPERGGAGLCGLGRRLRERRLREEGEGPTGGPECSARGGTSALWARGERASGMLG